MSKENGEVKTKNNKTQFQVVIYSTVKAVSESKNNIYRASVVF